PRRGPAPRKLARRPTRNAVCWLFGPNDDRCSVHARRIAAAARSQGGGGVPYSSIEAFRPRVRTRRSAQEPRSFRGDETSETPPEAPGASPGSDRHRVVDVVQDVTVRKSAEIALLRRDEEIELLHDVLLGPDHPREDRAPRRARRAPRRGERRRDDRPGWRGFRTRARRAILSRAAPVSCRCDS